MISTARRCGASLFAVRAGRRIVADGRIPRGSLCPLGTFYTSNRIVTRWVLSSVA